MKIEYAYLFLTYLIVAHEEFSSDYQKLRDP